MATDLNLNRVWQAPARPVPIDLSPGVPIGGNDALLIADAAQSEIVSADVVHSVSDSITIAEAVELQATVPTQSVDSMLLSENPTVRIIGQILYATDSLLATETNVELTFSEDNVATTYWLGAAPAVAQTHTITITAFDAGTTYKVTIGGVTVSVAGITSANSTASALATALNASTHPYFSAITWTVNAAVITATADVSGCPYFLTTSVTGGTGTISDAAGTACSGPNFWNVAANWSTGVVPAAGDVAIVADSAINICWGMDSNTVALSAIRVNKTFTGRIGLRRGQFATDAAGDTPSNTTVPEYRLDYLRVDYDLCVIGEYLGSGNATGSSRIKINNDKAGASDTFIFGTGSASEEPLLPAVRLLLSNASANIYVRSAPGGVGIAMDAPDETATVGRISISDTTSASRVFTSKGVTLTTWDQIGGIHAINAAGTITALTVSGGSLQTEGDYTITTANVKGGTYIPNHSKTSGNAITMLNLDGGTTDFRQSSLSRTVATVNMARGATLQYDSASVTFTAFNKPAGVITLAAT